MNNLKTHGLIKLKDSLNSKTKKMIKTLPKTIYEIKE